MNKKISLLCAVTMFAFITTSCLDNNSNVKQSVLPPTKMSLAGTKWKLVGFYDTETNILIEAEPKDCERCYTLEFDTDTTASGRSIINIIVSNLQSKHLLSVATQALDDGIGNVILFYDAIKTITSYEVNNEQLKFYYNFNKNYLLFKRRQ